MNYVKKIKAGTATLLLVNLFIFVSCLLFDLIFDVDLDVFLSTHPLSSAFFNPIQLITFMFTHSTKDILHILSNMLVLLLFAPLLEKSIGSQKLVLIYVVAGIVSFISFNEKRFQENGDLKKYIKKYDLELSRIKFKKSGDIQNNHYYVGLSEKQHYVIEDYCRINGPFLGSSGSVFGIVMFYILFSFFNKMNILLTLLGSLFVILTIRQSYNCSIEMSGTVYGHLGGIIGGALCFIIVKLKK